ncbi:MAG: class I SAM-dependent methyltransferase [bacterium]
MTFQWQLTPLMNRVIRSRMEEDRNYYLLKAGERMIDIGCGSGWLSHVYAKQGMEVLGLDISQEQICAANRLKEKESSEKLSFICCDLLSWDSSNYAEYFDCAFVNAFLHHLPESELQLTLYKIARILKPGGRVYFYEPLSSKQVERNWFVRVVDFFCNGIIVVLLSIIPKKFGLFSSRHQDEIARGYTMCSPHERPVEIEVLSEYASASFNIESVKPWHLFSIGVSMQIMSLKKQFRAPWTFLTLFYYLVDRFVFRLQPWQNFSLPGRFILCSLKMRKKHNVSQ